MARLDETLRSRYDLTPAQYADLLREARGHLEDIGHPLAHSPDGLTVLVAVDRNYVGGVAAFVVDISPLWDSWAGCSPDCDPVHTGDGRCER